MSAEALVKRLREQAASTSQHPDDKRTWREAAEVIEAAMTATALLEVYEQADPESERQFYAWDAFYKAELAFRRALSAVHARRISEDTL